jgi:hypothetical protein
LEHGVSGTARSGELEGMRMAATRRGGTRRVIVSFERLFIRSAALLAIACALATPHDASAVQASASLSVSPSNWGLLANGEEIDVTIRAHNTSGDTPSTTFGDGSAPKAASLQGPITVTLACANSACSVTTPGVLAFVPVGGNGCVAKNAGVSTCTSGGGSTVLINFGAAIPLPAAGSVDIAVIRVRVLSNLIAAQVGIRAATAVGAVTACSTNAPNICAMCGAEGCSKLAFIEDVIRGCPHPCPARIRFLSGLDSFEFHAEIDGSQTFDPLANPVTVTLSNALFDPIFTYTLPAGLLVPGTDFFRYTNGSAKTSGGFSIIKVGLRDGTANQSRFDVVLYDPNLEARATLANMKTVIQVGGDTFTVTADWTKTNYGWFFDLP